MQFTDFNKSRTIDISCIFLYIIKNTNFYEIKNTNFYEFWIVDLVLKC